MTLDIERKAEGGGGGRIGRHRFEQSLLNPEGFGWHPESRVSTLGS